MGLIIWAALALAALALAYGLLLGLGALAWSQGARAIVARLDAAGEGGRAARRDAAGEGGRAARHDAAGLALLPDPVRRYLGLALTDGQPVIVAAEIGLSGRFSMRLTPPRWLPFTSRQQVRTAPPGFVWDASIRLFPGFPVRVIDSYVAGTGLLTPKILGLFGVGEVRGGGEIARAELMRWLSEAVWYPTALLPGAALGWEAVDAHSARATLTDGPLAVTLLFRFGPDGMVASVHADARSAMVDGVTVMLPWECRLSDWQVRDGMRLPMAGEALYHTPDGACPYFRGRVTAVSYRFAGAGVPD